MSVILRTQAGKDKFTIYVYISNFPGNYSIEVNQEGPNLIIEAPTQGPQMAKSVHFYDVAHV